MKLPRVTVLGWRPLLVRLGGTRLLSRPACLVEVGAEGGQLSAVAPDTTPLPLPQELVAHGLELRFHGAIDGDTLDVAENRKSCKIVQHGDHRNCDISDHGGGANTKA